MLNLLKYLDVVFVAIAFIGIVLLFFRRLKNYNSEKSNRTNQTLGFADWFGKWGGIITAFFVLFGGWYVSYDLTREKESEMKQALRSYTLKLSRSIDAESVSNLSFTPDDSISPYYQRLSNQIHNYSQYSGIKRIYTISKKGDDYFFGPESLTPEDPNHHSAGEKYQNPPDELEDVFSDNVTRIVEPFKDEPASCFTPVISLDGDDVLMVVEVDIPAEEWTYNVHISKIKPLVIILLLLLLLFVGFRFMHLHSRSPLLQKRVFRYWEGGVTILIGLVVTFYFANLSENEKIKYQHSVFSHTASSEGVNISQSLQLVKHHFEGMAKLFFVSEEVTESEFNNYVSEVVNYPFIASAGWMKKDSDEQFSIKYLFQGENCILDTGIFFPYNDTIRKKPVKETFLTGLISGTDIFYHEGEKMMDLFLPTIDSQGDTIGLVYLSIYPDGLIDNLVSENAAHDDFYKAEITILNGSTEKENYTPFIPFLSENRALDYTHLDFFFGKVFSVYVTPGEGFFNDYRGSGFWSSFILGLIITFLITAVILLLSNRRFILEKQINKHVAHLKSSEERFRSLFSNMMEGVAFHEMKFNEEGDATTYKIVEINEAYEVIMGLESHKIVGRDADKVSELDQFLFTEEYSRVVEEQNPVVFEAYYAGNDKYLEISVAPWGKTGFATIFSDITKRRKAENRLKKSEARYRLISENAGDIIWLYDHEKEQFNYISPSVQKLSGFSYNELVGKGFKDVMTEASFKEIKYLTPLRIARFGLGDESMRSKTTRIDMLTREGGTVPLEVITTLLVNDEAKVTGILGVGRDISDRISAEEALKQNEEKYRLLVENQNDLVVKVDAEGYLKYVSPSYCRLFGKNEDELLNKKFLPLVHPDDRDATAKSMEKLQNPPHQVVLEQRAMTRDGWKWLSWNDTALLDESGNITEIIGVGRDITERKMAEEELRKSRELLERQNDEYATLNEEYLTMNEELSSINEDLSLAIERAEESEKLKTAFLQNMSHEIRTPLNAIIGFSEMLGMNNITNDDRKDFTTIIVNSSRQLLELVNDILTISAIETRQDKINFEPVYINDLLSELYTIFRTKAKEKAIEIKVQKTLNNQKAVLIADELKLRQVFVNLLGNALKFTKEGVVEFGYEVEGDSYFRFYVKDTGVGISKAMETRIFERFMQADNSIKGNYGGTGLGLAICKGHIEMMGGEIWVESTPGVGSAFYFTLPVQGNN